MLVALWLQLLLMIMMMSASTLQLVSNFNGFSWLIWIGNKFLDELKLVHAVYKLPTQLLPVTCVHKEESVGTLLHFQTSTMARLGTSCLCVALIITALMTVSLQLLSSIHNSLRNYFTVQDLLCRWLIFALLDFPQTTPV